MTNIRPSPIAGSWYPGNARDLSSDLQGYLEAAHVERPPGRLWGIIVPHAAYRYSGAIAASAFRCLEGLRPEMVVVISPLHFHHPARLLTTAHSAYQTPLGPVAVDVESLHELSRRLQSPPAAAIEPLVCDREHSLEIELPFLQVVLGTFRLLPIMMRDQSPETAVALGTALAESLKGREVLFVASSDLAHHIPESRARALDASFLDGVEHFEIDRVAEGRSGAEICACGSGAVAAALCAAQRMGADRVTLLRHGTSAEATGDSSSVVGYAALAIWQAGGERSSEPASSSRKAPA